MHRIIKNGYVRIADGKSIDTYEHRLVMEQKLNRKLDNNELVHHKDGNKQNNQEENLELINRKNHINFHRKTPEIIKLICPICKTEKEIRKKLYLWKKKKGQKDFYCSRRCVGISGGQYFHNSKDKNNELDNLITIELRRGLTGYKIAKKYELNRATVYNHINNLKPE